MSTISKRHFLDEEGLSILWEKVKSRIDSSVSTVQSDLNEVKPDIATLKSNYTALSADFISLQDSLNDLYDSIPNSESIATDIDIDRGSIKLKSGQSYIGNGVVVEDILNDSNTISGIKGSIGSLDSKYAELKSRIDGFNPCDCEALVEIQKDGDGEYYLKEEDKDNAPTAGSVVIALNQVKEEFKATDHSAYYTKEEANNKFVWSENLLSEEDIETIFK